MLRKICYRQKHQGNESCEQSYLREKKSIASLKTFGYEALA